MYIIFLENVTIGPSVRRRERKRGRREGGRERERGRREGERKRGERQKRKKKILKVAKNKQTTHSHMHTYTIAYTVH